MSSTRILSVLLGTALSVVMVFPEPQFPQMMHNAGFQVPMFNPFFGFKMAQPQSFQPLSMPSFPKFVPMAMPMPATFHQPSPPAQPAGGLPGHPRMHLDRSDYLSPDGNSGYNHEVVNMQSPDGTHVVSRKFSSSYNWVGGQPSGGGARSVRQLPAPLRSFRVHPNGNIHLGG